MKIRTFLVAAAVALTPAAPAMAQSSDSPGEPGQMVKIPKPGPVTTSSNAIDAAYNRMLGNDANDQTSMDPIRQSSLALAYAPLMLSSVVINPILILEEQLGKQGLWGYTLPNP